MSPKRRKGPTPRKQTTNSIAGGGRVHVEKRATTISIPGVVSYRFFVNGELRQEVPHRGKGRLRAEEPNITPGVTLRVGIESVSSYGVTSGLTKTEGAAPFED